MRQRSPSLGVPIVGRVLRPCPVEQTGEDSGVSGIETIDETLQDRRPVSGSAEEPLYLSGDPARFGTDWRIGEGASGSGSRHLPLCVEPIEDFGDGCVGHVSAEASSDFGGAETGRVGPQDAEDLGFEFARCTAVRLRGHLDILRHVS